MDMTSPFPPFPLLSFSLPPSLTSLFLPPTCHCDLPRGDQRIGGNWETHSRWCRGPVHSRPGDHGWQIRGCWGSQSHIRSTATLYMLLPHSTSCVVASFLVRANPFFLCRCVIVFSCSAIWVVFRQGRFRLEVDRRVDTQSPTTSERDREREGE